MKIRIHYSSDYVDYEDVESYQYDKNFFHIYKEDGHILVNKDCIQWINIDGSED